MIGNIIKAYDRYEKLSEKEYQYKFFSVHDKNR